MTNEEFGSLEDLNLQDSNPQEIATKSVEKSDNQPVQNANKNAFSPDNFITTPKVDQPKVESTQERVDSKNVENNSILIQAHPTNTEKKELLTEYKEFKNHKVLVARFQPLQLQLLLNVGSFPILNDQQVVEELALQASQYVERLNAFREVCQYRSETQQLLNAANTELLTVQREFSKKRAQAYNKICEELEEPGNPRSKKRYTNAESRDSALTSYISTNPELLKLDDRIFSLKNDCNGYTSRLEALRVESKALEAEISALKENLRFFVDSGLASMNLSPLEQENTT